RGQRLDTLGITAADRQHSGEFGLRPPWRTTAQMALATLRPHDFATARHPETFGSRLMCFEFILLAHDYAPESLCLFEFGARIISILPPSIFGICSTAATSFNSSAMAFNRS